MTILIFSKIRWQNFLSTGNMFTEIQLNSHNNTLICGVNGSGKSTLIDAITFVLFGKSFRNINKPQLINSTNSKNMLVEIEFSINGNKYIVRRGMKPNIFEIYQNGTLINQSADSKDYQSILEKTILKMNYKSFCQVVVLGSANFTPFMLLPAAQRRAFVEDLLDIQIFTTMNALLKDKTAENKFEITDCDTKIKIAENTLEVNKKHRERASRDIMELISQKETLIKETQLELDTHNSEFSSLEIKSNQLQSKISKNRQKNKNALDKAYNMRTALESKLKGNEKGIAFYQGNDSCPTCEQHITSDFKDKKLLDISTKKEENESILKELSEKISKLEKNQEQIISWADELQQLNKELIELSSKINFCMKVISSYEKDIKDLNNNSLVEIDDTETINKLNYLKKTKEHLFAQRELYNVGLVLLKDGGIKAKIIKQYIPVINQMINKYLDDMEFFCQFTIDETFEEKIKSRYRDAFTFESFSEGEKMRLNLAILFTWRELARMRNSAATNLLILDEIMDSSLDSSGTEEFIKIVQSLTKRNNVFVISHKTDQIQERFENIIRFEKKKNFSKIVE